MPFDKKAIICLRYQFVRTSKGSFVSRVIKLSLWYNLIVCCNGYIFFQSLYRQTTTLTSRMSSKVAMRNQRMRRRTKIAPSQKRPPLKRPLTTWEGALPRLPSKTRIQLPRPRSTTPWRPPLKVSWGRRGRSRARARSNHSSLHLTSWDRFLALTAGLATYSIFFCFLFVKTH